jgi:hypothetical protein
VGVGGWVGVILISFNHIHSHTLKIAELVGVQKMIACIGDSAGGRSICLHRAAGFSHVVIFKSFGWKSYRWFYVIFRILLKGMQSGTNRYMRVFKQPKYPIKRFMIENLASICLWNDIIWSHFYSPFCRSCRNGIV